MRKSLSKLHKIEIRTRTLLVKITQAICRLAMRSAPLALAMLAFTVTVDHASASDGKQRYTVASGKGWKICESYVTFLNGTPAGEAPPLCNLKLDRVQGMRALDWEVLDLQQNLGLVHQIELLLGSPRVERSPDRDFERWKAHLRARIDTGEQPRLRRTRTSLVPQKSFTVDKATGAKKVATGRIETLLAYDVDTKRCEKELAKARDGRLHDHSLVRPNVFVFDEAAQRVMGSANFALRLEGEWGAFDGRPHFVQRIYSEVEVDRGKLDLGGHLYVKRLEPRYNPPAGDPPYIDRQLCHIRFDYPFPRLNYSNATTDAERVICGVKKPN